MVTVGAAVIAVIAVAACWMQQRQRNGQAEPRAAAQLNPTYELGAPSFPTGTVASCEQSAHTGYEDYRGPQQVTGYMDVSIGFDDADAEGDMWSTA